MIDQVMFRAAHSRGAARLSAACFFADFDVSRGSTIHFCADELFRDDNGGGSRSPLGFCTTIFADDLGHCPPNGVRSQWSALPQHLERRLLSE